jgi:translation initiation factor IF-3
MDYGKFLYEKNKSSKEQKRKQKIIQIKEVKFRPGTDDGDYQVKLRSLTRFLEDGNKVKITLRFRGREMAHQKSGMTILSRIRKDLCEEKNLAIVESFPSKVESRQVIMLLSSKRK